MEKTTIKEIKTLVEEVIKEQAEQFIQKMKINGKLFGVFLIDEPFNPYLYVLDSEGDYYCDISTQIPDNPLLDAIWVKVGGIEEIFANKLKILQMTDAITKSGYNTYKKYNIIR